MHVEMNATKNTCYYLITLKLDFRSAHTFATDTRINIFIQKMSNFQSFTTQRNNNISH